MDEHLPVSLCHVMDVDLRGGGQKFVPSKRYVESSTNLEVLQDTHDPPMIFNPLFLVPLGDTQRTRERVVFVIRVEGRIDLVEVAVDETLGPCHDGLDLGALLGRSGHECVWRSRLKLRGL